MLNVSGTATLSGLLTVQALTPGFQPQLSDNIPFLNAPAVTGRFDVAFFPGLGNGLFLQLQYPAAAQGGSSYLTKHTNPLAAADLIPPRSQDRPSAYRRMGEHYIPKLSPPTEDNLKVEL